MNTSTTSIRVFTHKDQPKTSAIVAQASDLAAMHGLGIEFVAVDTDGAAAIAVGVIGLPAIIVLSDNTEIARRECAFAGRGTRRWFERKVGSGTVLQNSIPVMA